MESDKKQFKERVSDELEGKLAKIRQLETENNFSKIAQKHGLKFFDIRKFPISNDALSVLDENSARKALAIVISKKGKHVTVAITDPDEQNTRETIEALKGRGLEVDIVITIPDAIEESLKRYSLLPHHESVELGAIELNDDELEKLGEQIKDIEDLKQKIRSVAVTKVLDILIAGALKTGASDIHFEPSKESTKIRYRFDGILHDISLIDRTYYDKMVSRVKIISKMKLNIHNSPQDGRLTIHQGNVDIEVRSSVLPSEFGEAIVLRLLDPRIIRQEMESMGARKDLLDLIKKELTRPNGAIVTTGPTGSGKTTALYAFITYIASPQTKIITIEDPIEYHVSGISQTQVDPSRGYTFANGLRAIVRQDPNVILVGEIRDDETADIALNAALTGHLVLTTLHTNDAAGAIPRLIDLGAKPEVIAPAINLVLAQRLIRKLCQTCKKKVAIPKDRLDKIQVQLEKIEKRFNLPKITEKTEVYGPAGCDQCNNSGYKGRIGTFEGFLVSPEIEELILQNPTISSIRNHAIEQGMVTMLQDSYMKLLAGVTSLEEIERVVG